MRRCVHVLMVGCVCLFVSILCDCSFLFVCLIVLLVPVCLFAFCCSCSNVWCLLLVFACSDFVITYLLCLFFLVSVFVCLLSSSRLALPVSCALVIPCLCVLGLFVTAFVVVFFLFDYCLYERVF